MEKQILIKHSNSDRVLKIENIISYLELFVDSPNDKIVINFCINANQSKIIHELSNLSCIDNGDIINFEASKKHVKFDVVIDMDNVVHILNIIENHEINVVIYCNNIKMFINDNDGDFVIIDSKHKKYNIIKNKRLKDRKSKKTKKL